MSQEEVFWDRVIRTGPDECWEWNPEFPRPWRGAGAFTYGGKYMSAHRVAYLLTYGQLPGTVVQTCGNRACCNPAHLTIGSSGRKSKGEPLITWGFHWSNRAMSQINFLVRQAKRRGNASRRSVLEPIINEAAVKAGWSEEKPV